MKNLKITLFLSFCLVFLASNSLYAQSKSDACDGNISTPSYTEESDWHTYEYTHILACDIKFNDGTRGTLFFNKKLDKYFTSRGAGVRFYYSSLSMAMKALYVYKKFDCTMSGYSSQ